MLFSAFKALVLENLDVDANRLGTLVLRDRAMQNAMADMQRLIPDLQPVQGIKASWSPSDELPDLWDAICAECVAEWVKAKLVGRYDKNKGLADDHKLEYARLRGAIAREIREGKTAATTDRNVLQVFKGKTFHFEFEVSRSIVGAVIEFIVKNQKAQSIPDKSAPIYISSEDIDSPIFVMDDDAGKFSVTGVADINSFPTYEWVIQIKFDDGSKVIPQGMRGSFIVISDAD